MSLLFRPNIIFFLGPPGSGKGTQCSFISKTFNCEHISAGNLLREEQARPDSEFYEIIKYNIDNGYIVPVDITCNLIKNAIVKSGKRNFVIDGFPRNMDNYDGWNRVMGDYVDLKSVISLECPFTVCEERCLGRNRSDDDKSTFLKRLHTFRDSTLEILDIFDNAGLLYKVDGCGTPEEIFSRMKSHCENAFS